MTANSSVEFLLWLLIAASAIAVIAKRVGIPYTVALVLGGLLLSIISLPALAPLHKGNRPDWLTPDVILTLFLPALLFEGSLKIELRHIRTNIVPLLLLANFGVLIATLVTGFVVYYAVGMSLIVALLFGAMVSATDPISVLSIFKEVPVDERLSVLVEGESLLNDGTAVALFQILLASAVGGGVGLVWGAGQFLLSVVGGALLGLALGYLVSQVTKRIDDPQIEITFTTILAYGTFLLARHLHLSGVIATVAAGLVIGNFAAKTGMSARTLTALRSFWEYASFIINSLVFLLIGLEVRLEGVLHTWKPILIAILAILLGRILSVYTLVPLSNLFSKPISLAWQHVLVWGGLRGALSLALALSLDSTFPYRDQILNLTFGVVVFSILVQGLSIKPLLRILRLAPGGLHEQRRYVPPAFSQGGRNRCKCCGARTGNRARLGRPCTGMRRRSFVTAGNQPAGLYPAHRRESGRACTETHPLDDHLQRSISGAVAPLQRRPAGDSRGTQRH